VASGVVVLALAGAGFWYFFLRNDAPPPVSLEAAATAASSSSTSGSSGDLSGTWSIQSGANSFAGYRVNETLAGFGSRTAVGRTQSLQGTLAYDGRAISSVKVVADLTALKSDQSLRDDTLKMQAIQSCQFPDATFDLSTPITLDGSTGNDSAVSKTVQGNLTLHGVTRPVSIDVKGQFQNGVVAVVGSTDIKFADYAIQQPRSVYVVSLDDHGIMEFQLLFSKGTPPTAASTAVPQATSTPVSGCGPPPGGPPPGGPPPGGGFPPINTPAPVPSPVS
jgi:polyisoprenoid-binding protein YceI